MAHREWCLRPGERLNTNEYLRSKNGLFYAVMQGDANFIIYKGDWWEISNPARASMWNLFGVKGYKESLSWVHDPYSAVMQDDGNFVIYADAGAHALWSTSTNVAGRDPGNPYWAVMQDDGNFCIKPNGDIKESPAFKTGPTDRLVDEKNIALADIVYDFANAIVKPNGEPKHAASNTAVNKTDINQSVTLTLSYTESTAKGWKTSTTLKIGTKTTFKCGVPSIVEGKVEASAELTQGFEWNETKTKSETKTISLPVVVQPGKGVIGQVTWSESTITLPFRVKGMGTFASGTKVPVSVNGVYEGIASHDVHTKWIPYTENEADSARAMLSAAPSTVLP